MDTALPWCMCCVGTVRARWRFTLPLGNSRESATKYLPGGVCMVLSHLVHGRFAVALHVGWDLTLGERKLTPPHQGAVGLPTCTRGTLLPNDVADMQFVSLKMQRVRQGVEDSVLLAVCNVDIDFTFLTIFLQKPVGRKEVDNVSMYTPFIFFAATSAISHGCVEQGSASCRITGGAELLFPPRSTRRSL